MTAEKNTIDLGIEKLRQLTQLDVLSNWRYNAIDLPLTAIWQTHEWDDWPVVELNEKKQIIWSSGKQVRWLVQKIVIPHHIYSYPLAGLTLRLALTWWAEDVQIFVNGELVQTGDLFDYFTRIWLSSSVTPGWEIFVALRLLSPGHDRGALMRSLLIYESNDAQHPEPGFVANELAVLQSYFKVFDIAKLDILENAIADIDWSSLPNAAKFNSSLFNFRQNLFSKIEHPQSKIYLLGHAHLDMAWLWPVKETWIAAQRTFESVLKLQQEFPDLIFCHSTPALYAWMEEHRPDLFAAIQTQVKAGRWEIVGGMWIEPDLNLIGGESIVRQIFYGQRYVKEKFDQFTKVAWVPDTFGFCATLPQFLELGCIEYFVTQKLSWNDTTKFPYGFFWWRSPDGSQIFSLMSALIGEDIDPLKMANYAVDWQRKTNLENALWLPGVGDHGGGPTRDMLEVAHRWQKSPFFPQLEFTTAENYLQNIEKLALDRQSPIPIWDDELYLEFHRGCYTTHADQKRYNRRCEGLLYQAELFASLATISAKVSYPKIELEQSWKKLLFNQFHDILPGTSIPEVFVDANQDWQEVERVGAEILQKSLNAIASQISLPPAPHPNALPIVVFNGLNWERSQVVAINLPTSHTWQVCDWEGNPILTQQISPTIPLDFPSLISIDHVSTNQPITNSVHNTLLFVANNVSAVGYRLFWLSPLNAETPINSLIDPENIVKSNKAGKHNTSILVQDREFVQKDSLNEKDWLLENEFILVKVNPETGNLSRIFDKVNHQEILDQLQANQLQAFQDDGQYWDGWNIDPNYAQHPLPTPELKSIEWIYKGEVQQRLRVVRQIGQSEFCQDYLLDMIDPILKICTTVNWQESHVLVKAAFPFNFAANSATYEIACGAIDRTTQPQTPAEKAKWEVPALRWADLSTDGCGVSILNDGKYGYDAQPNQLRLTLLRSPTWPNPSADRGVHQFTYALYPHNGNWRSSNTVRHGYELNLPLQPILLDRSTNFNQHIPPSISLPPIGQLLNLSSPNLILMAFKQSEEHPHHWILRCYECHGEQAELNLKSDLNLQIAQSVDILERPVQMPEPLTDHQNLSISPWKIVSFEVYFSRS